MHLCSTNFLNECLAMFRQISESEAVKFVGKQLPGTEPQEEVKDTKKKKGKKPTKEIESAPT